MKILFIHQNYPAQFRHIAGSLIKEGIHQVTCLCENYAPGLNGTQTYYYKKSRDATKGVHPYLSLTEDYVIRGQSVARALLALKQKGYMPDIIVAHMGWGEAFYPKEIYPEVPLVTFFEFFYHAHGADVGFDPEYPADLNDCLRVRTKNIINWLSLDVADVGISPTEWQRSLYPKEFQGKIRLIHEGINTDVAIPNANAVLTLPNGQTLSRNDEVITYVSRNLEPYRGFHVFMRSLAHIQKRRPNAHIIVVGGDDVSYGAKPRGEGCYREQLLKEVGSSVDLSKIHFLGKVPYQQYLQVLQISTVHIYLTYPFVLSWSMLEAMSAGCLVVGSKTQPVTEVLKDGENGLLVDFFDKEGIAERIDQVFKHPDQMQALRGKARQTVVEKYPLQAGIQQYRTLFNELLSK